MSLSGDSDHVILSHRIDPYRRSTDCTGERRLVKMDVVTVNITGI